MVAGGYTQRGVLATDTGHVQMTPAEQRRGACTLWRRGNQRVMLSSLDRLRVLIAAVAWATWGCAPAPDAAAISGDLHGLTLGADVAATDRSITIDALVRNERDEPIHLVPDQCGRVTDAELERTELLPEGQRWDGAVQTVKDLVLRGQRFLDRPDPFHPRRVTGRTDTTPECIRPQQPIRLEPGTEIAERWELPLDTALALKERGSAGTVVSLEAVEARDPDEPEYLDILPSDAEEEARRGRVVRAELQLSEVLDLDAGEPPAGPSPGELFDRLLADADVRAWLEAQPADGWMSADLSPAAPDRGLPTVRLKLITKAYERAALVEAQPDGSNPHLDAPGEEFRTREFTRVAGTLPPGTEALPDADYTLSEELQIGEVLLPSGRVIVGEYLLDAEPLPFTVAAGGYPAQATLARHKDDTFDTVALATLVLSDAPTVTWRSAGAVAVDGGTTSITSVEGRDALNRIGEDDANASREFADRIFDSLMAHDGLATEFEITPETNLAQYSSGVGDGGYPVYIGFDAGGQPTRVVVDFLILHLVWPGTSSG